MADPVAYHEAMERLRTNPHERDARRVRGCGHRPRLPGVHRAGARRPRRLPRPHLDAARGDAAARARPAEGRLRRDGVARAAHAAHVDDGLPRDDPRGRGRRAERRAAPLPRDRLPQLGAAAAARRRPALRRAARRERAAAAVRRRRPRGRRARQRRVDRGAGARAREIDAALGARGVAAVTRATASGWRSSSRNLLSNAIKFTPEGGRVTIRDVRRRATRRSSRSRTPGSASPPPSRTRLFQRFFRSTTATEQAIPGTGLGLVITKAIAEAHGGIDRPSLGGRAGHVLPREPAARSSIPSRHDARRRARRRVVVGARCRLRRSRRCRAGRRAPRLRRSRRRPARRRLPRGARAGRARATRSRSRASGTRSSPSTRPTAR